MVKRIFDVFVAAVGLVLLSPLLLFAAVLVKLDSPGPVLFRQVRVGRGGRTFRIRKFRTMQVAGSSGMQVTIAGDRRITRVGRLLRATKIDELPQLIDVLGGQMSIVGPRPEVPRYVELYPEDLRRQVLSVRPGITDFASIQFRHESELLAGASDPEAAYREEILPAKLALAAEYVRTRTFLVDLQVIWRTIGAVLSRRRPPVDINDPRS